MQVKQLDHVNIQTANVEGMVEWYGRILNMPSGKRPPFDFPGAWLYCGEHPVVQSTSAGGRSGRHATQHGETPRQSRRGTPYDPLPRSLLKNPRR